MAPQLPTYLSQGHSYQPLGSHHHDASSSKSQQSRRRLALRFVVAVSLLAVAFSTSAWYRSHPTFFEEYRIAKSLSVDAHLTLHPTIMPFNQESTASSQASPPVPQLEASILGVAESTPNYFLWKATASSAASIPAYPRVIQPGPGAPTTDQILFAMATNADRAISQARWWLWPSFLSNPSSPCFVLLPPEDAHRVKEVVAEFKKQGLDCIAVASKEKRYQLRVLSLPSEAMQAYRDRGKDMRWLVMGDE